MTSQYETTPAVLLVEDNPAVADCLEATLKETGLTVRKASTMTRGIELFKREPFSIAILDVHLPDDSDHKLARTIRLLDSRLPIIIMTGFPSGRSINQSLNVAAEAYLMKPFSAEKILRLVGGILAQTAAVPKKHRWIPR